MPLDPQLADVLTSLAAGGAPPMTAGSPQTARTAFETASAALQALAPLPQVGEISDRAVAGIPVRIYRPPGQPTAGEATHPTVLVLHGGGWVIGSIASHDDQARRLCRDLSAVVVALNYRLAPEHPFPAAVNDSWQVFEWVCDQVAELGGDPDRIAVAGDSAGGNLAAVLAHRARDAGRPLAAQLLVYPAVDAGGDYPSRLQNAEGYFLTLPDTRWFLRNYLGGADPVPPSLLADPELSPLQAATLAGLAPAVVVTAEYDPLRDEGNAYADALAGAGVPVVQREFAGLVHGFFGMGALSAAAEQATAWTVLQFGRLLGA